MQELSVLYLSRVVVPPGAGFRTHTHDYWHFALALSGQSINQYGITNFPPFCSCYPPGTPNPGSIVTAEHTALNVMFQVNDPTLADRLAKFQFRLLRPEALHIPVWEHIMEEFHKSSPGPELVNAAFAYYLHLLLESPQAQDAATQNAAQLSERVLSFIEENYAQPITLEMAADHISRSRTYTSHLISTSTGTTFMEHLHSIRIRHACSLLAYSDIPQEEVAVRSGFSSTKNFVRVFGQKMGTTPNRYRTSHMRRDWYYTGDIQDLSAKYTQPVYTYVPAARKCVDWQTPLDYLTQKNHTF